jgi:hypothetical protein
MRLNLSIVYSLVGEVIKEVNTEEWPSAMLLGVGQKLGIYLGFLKK